MLLAGELKIVRGNSKNAANNTCKLINFKTMNKTVRRVIIELLTAFGITQPILMYIDIHIFNSITSWTSGTIFGIIMGMTMMYENRFIGQYIRKKASWLKSPLKTFLLTFSIGSFCTIVSICILNYIYLVWFYNMSFEQFIEPNIFSIKLAILMYLCASLITHAIVFYIQWKNLAIEHEKQKTEAIKLRFEALRNQVNPHFLFNCLSSLTHLIRTDQDKAVDFTNSLSDTFHYLLEFNDKDLVSLTEEMKLVEAYLLLQEIRFKEYVTVHNQIQTATNWQVIPVSVQMTIENVFKHNVISRDNTITIELWIEDDYLKIRNNINPKPSMKDHIPSGLANIRNRYEYLSKKPCVIEQTPTHFAVSLPLLNYEL